MTTEENVAEGRPRALPVGTLTFLFTDIEGSTCLLQELGKAYASALSDHRTAIGAAADRAGGRIFGSEGDALFIVFSDAPSALVAAADAQKALAAHAWPAGRDLRVRMGIHTGDAAVVGGDYVGLPLHQVARIAAAGHGGQVVLSEATHALASRSLPTGISIRDLGVHRLKDLAAPEHLYELAIAGLERSFPPLRTLDAHPNNLPVQLTSFVGRDEVDQARGLLAGSRLLTLTGPGGTGKTRLALQLAAELLDEFPDGVFFVPLDAVLDSDWVPSAIFGAIGLEPGSQPPITRLIEYLRDKRLLLVLDNFEQIVAGAPIVGRLLEAAPNVKALVTSRIVLRITGEQEFPVPPLDVPEVGAGVSTEAIARSPSVRLFVERAMASQPSFALTDGNAAAIADVVIQLDGLPLAIELAAARVRVLPVEALRSRLGERLAVLVGGSRDRPERQQTLRGAIDWSYDLLDAADRRLFERESVFAGGVSLSQAEEVCGPAAELGRDVLDGLASLVDASLIRPVPASEIEPRFTMLATIRDYAVGRLDSSGEAESIGRRHANAYVDLVESSADKLTGSSGRHWLDRLELDHDNIRAALDWATARNEAEIALRMVTGVWRFWQIRGHLTEARERIERVLALPGVADQPPDLRARGFGAAGSVAYWRGDSEATHRHYATALENARRSGDRAIIAEALYNFAFAAQIEATGDLEAFRVGKSAVDEALALYHELGDQAGIANASWALGTGALTLGDYEGAKANLRESLSAYRALGDPFGTGWALHELATVALLEGDLDAAERMFREALDTLWATADLSAVVLILFAFTTIAKKRGQLDRALRLGAAAIALQERTGTDLPAATASLFRIEWPSQPSGDPGAVRAWDEGAAMTVEEAIAYAREGGAPDPDP